MGGGGFFLVIGDLLSRIALALERALSGSPKSNRPGGNALKPSIITITQVNRVTPEMTRVFEAPK